MGIFKEKWFSFVDNKAINERNNRKSKTWRSPSNQYNGAAKSKNIPPNNVKTRITYTGQN